MKKSRFMSLIVTASLTVTLVACSTQTAQTQDKGKSAASAAPTAAPAKAVTITFQTLQTDKTSPAYQIEDKIAQNYMKENPNVKIEFDHLDIEPQKLKLKTQAAANEVPDITMVNPGAQMKPFVDGGVLAPLNDLLEDKQLSDTFQEGILDYFTFDKKVYALPYNNNIAGIFYNKDLFQKAGVKVPTTFEELVDITKTLKAKDILPMAIAGKDKWPLSFMFMNILQRENGNPGFLQDVLDGKKNFLDPAFVQSIQKVQDLMAAGAYEEGATSIDYTAAQNEFTTGKAAMFYMGTWALATIDVAAEVKGKIGFLQFPTVDGKGSPDQFMVAPGTSYALGANSKHLDESKKFLKYLMLNYPKVAFDLKAAVGLAQKVTGDYKAAGYSDLAIDVLGIFNKVKGGDLNFDNVIEPKTTQTHLTSLQNLFIKKIKAEDIAKEHQNAWELNNKK